MDNKLFKKVMKFKKMKKLKKVTKAKKNTFRLRLISLITETAYLKKD